MLATHPRVPWLRCSAEAPPANPAQGGCWWVPACARELLRLLSWLPGQPRFEEIFPNFKKDTLAQRLSTWKSVEDQENLQRAAKGKQGHYQELCIYCLGVYTSAGSFLGCLQN